MAAGRSTHIVGSFPNAHNSTSVIRFGNCKYVSAFYAGLDTGGCEYDCNHAFPGNNR